jgi:hypothetical protein
LEGISYSLGEKKQESIDKIFYNFNGREIILKYNNNN